MTPDDCPVAIGLRELPQTVGGPRAEETGGGSRYQHPRRPSSALLPTYIGTNAEPVLFFYMFF